MVVVAGLLGLQGVVYVLLALGFVVLRQVWRNAEAKKDEIMKLVEDAAMAEMQAAVYAAKCSSVRESVSSSAQFYQCAVCYSPTTMRCSRCKAVRYWYISFPFFFYKFPLQSNPMLD